MTPIFVIRVEGEFEIEAPTREDAIEQVRRQLPNQIEIDEEFIEEIPE